jgi:hypothetical protein
MSFVRFRFRPQEPENPMYCGIRVLMTTERMVLLHLASEHMSVVERLGILLVNLYYRRSTSLHTLLGTTDIHSHHAS